jgi:actin related protein 2/3 complex, subunit 5
MSPILSRIYQSEGGSEALDTLMKYMYVVALSHEHAVVFRGYELRMLMKFSYKGMSQTTHSSGKPASPQVTGFSQIQGRTLGGGDAGAMSVLLSWHEKVCVIQRAYPKN